MKKKKANRRETKPGGKKKRISPRLDRVKKKAIKDWDFSKVTAENAEVVWIYEVFRQCAVEGVSPPGESPSDVKKLIRTPWNNLSPEELENTVNTRFASKRDKYLMLHLHGDGRLTGKTGETLFSDEGLAVVAPYGANRYGFYLNGFLTAQVARKAVMRWFDQYVAPHLRRGPSRGRKDDRILWLADLAVYRAAKSGARYGKLIARLTRVLPPEKRFLSKSFISRPHLSDAKRRTAARLKDIREKTHRGSWFAQREVGPMKVVGVN